MKPTSVAQLDARPTGDQEVAGSTPLGFDHQMISTVILSLPLIQEGQLSVSGERMCTILVNLFEDQACPVKVWLGKLTALDMTPHWVDWAVKPQHNKQNFSYELPSLVFSEKMFPTILFYREN